MATPTHFLRYPGSKRRILNFLGRFLPSAKDIRRYYVEPFLGGGAVYFFIDPRQAILSDLNNELIDLYYGIRQDPQRVWDYYSSFGNDKTEYHRIRDGEQIDDLFYKAARILYLNRTCFKGMWRHNLNGKFNVGYGGEERRWVINFENLRELSISLQKAEINHGDFQPIIEACEEGDFIFLDPPYKPNEREQFNQHYVGKSFSFIDHKRLSNTLEKATEKGSLWALTVSSHKDILDLYIGNYGIGFTKGTGKQPGILGYQTGEILITNYPILGGTLL